MFNVVRFTLLRYIPAWLLQMLPPPDLRRDVAWGMFAVGIFMLSLARFAVFGRVNTLFTATLAHMGIETEWGLIMFASGFAQCLASFLPWRVLQVAIYGVSGIVLIWTYVITGLLHHLATPTVDACLGIGIVMLIGAVAKAQQSVMICARQRGQTNDRPEYG